MKNLILFITASVVIGVWANNASAQYYNSNISGRPISIQSNSEIIGTPYLLEDWNLGTVKLADGKTYQVMMKYDEAQDKLIYKNEKEEIMEFVNPVIGFDIKSKDGKQMKFVNGIANVPDWNAESYFQLLSDGDVKLVKKYIKTVQEAREYNAAAVKKSYVDSELYFVISNGEAKKIKANKKTILSVLANKGNEISNYIESNKISFKNDADLSNVFNHYNSINK